MCCAVLSRAAAQSEPPLPPPPPPPPAASEPPPPPLPAAADPTPAPLPAAPEPPTPPPPAAPWYGWQILLADGAALVTAAVVASTHDSDATSLGLFAGTWYGLGLVVPSAVHYGNRRPAAGLASIPMRGFAPPVVGVFGLVTSCLSNSEFDRSCTKSGMAIGSLIGSAGAAAFDALLLARPRVFEPHSNTHWYGLQILALDALSLGAGAIYAGSEPRAKNGPMHPAIAVWVTHYTIGFIGAPIIHFVHGEVGRGFGALGLRMLGGPIAGSLFGLMGFCAATAGADDCAEDGALWGLVGGGLMAAAIDAFVLARESAPASSEKASNFGVTVGAGTLGFHGRW